jgi:flagellar hook assembly protein FlgD
VAEPVQPGHEHRFSLASEGNAELRVYNIRGQLVKTLVSGAQSAGARTR